MINKNIIKDYNNNGVVVLRNIVSKKWITILKRGLKKNFKNPSKYKCVYEINNKKEPNRLKIQKTDGVIILFFFSE